jgi:phosphodiesterase/alkaline phosphatase D-like protein
MAVTEAFRRSPIHLGPIVGAVGKSEAKFWLRTRWPSTFHVECICQSGDRITSPEIVTGEASDFAGVAKVEGLLPETAYRYTVVVDSIPYTSDDFNFKTAPEKTRSFSFSFGSCYRPLVTKNGVMAQLYQACCQDYPSRPSFLLSIGDQIYADQSGVHGTTWKAATFDEFCEIYQKSWGADEYFMKLLARCPAFMIFDDHEVENAWFKLHRQIDPLRGVSGEDRLSNALAAYQCYQNSNNPEPISENLPYTYKFSWGDVQFFVIDARNQRQTNSWHQLFPYHRDILGEDQFKELTKWLDEYKDNLKFVITSVPVSHIGIQLPFLAPFPLFNRLAQVDQWPGFSWGRRRLISYIKNQGISRVVFLAGDVHISHYIEFLPFSRGKRFYQFTCSPFANDTKVARIQRWFLADHVWGYRKNLAQLNFFEDPCFGLINVQKHDGNFQITYSVIDERGGLFPMSPQITL